MNIEITIITIQKVGMMYNELFENFTIIFQLKYICPHIRYEVDV